MPWARTFASTYPVMVMWVFQHLIKAMVNTRYEIFSIMGLPGFIMDMKYWAIGGIVLACVLPVVNVDPNIVMFVLMAQMVLSLDTLPLNKTLVKFDRRLVWLTMFFCYVFNSIISVLFGLPFLLTNPEVWYGWAMIAAIPCGICVVLMCVITKGDVLNAFRVIILSYTVGLIYSPLVSWVLIGNAINPLEILEYLILFIVFPLLLSRVFTKYPLKREVKVSFLNIMIAMLVFFPLNQNHDLIFNHPEIIALIFVMCIARCIVLHLGSLWFIRVFRIPESQKGMYLTLGVMKSTGLALSMVLLVIPDVFEATVPCFCCVIVEIVWLSIMTKRYEIKDPVPDASPS